MPTTLSAEMDEIPPPCSPSHKLSVNEDVGKDISVALGSLGNDKWVRYVSQLKNLATVLGSGRDFDISCIDKATNTMKNKLNTAKHYNVEGAGSCSIHSCDRRTSARKCA
ncbi:hypothetical protein FGIG_07644 [Fasciola gigantica]|uniref:Uncharacterized protein n=1 Tax=Fasciola gigantica TaxID=46835 RepID=A0A504ZD80_FASGI|nr:hypothetical protein FGIG_07644 [Fasciola gigantica]